MIESLIGIVVYLLIIGVIFYVIWWAIGAIGPPEPIGKVIRVVVVLILVLVLLHFLLGLFGALPPTLKLR